MDVIRNILETICRLSDDFLQNRERRTDGWVILSNFSDHDGKLSESTRNKIVMAVYNITHETTISTYTAAQPGRRGEYAIVQPPLYVDLHLIFMANFIDRAYPEGLAAISRIISFFQQNPWFTQENAPQLDRTVDKITLEFADLSPVDVNYVMSMLGTRYLPSVFYKLRLIPFTSNTMSAKAYPARGSTPGASPENGGQDA